MADAGRTPRGVTDTSVVIDLENVGPVRLPLHVAVMAELAAGWILQHS